MCIRDRPDLGPAEIAEHHTLMMHRPLGTAGGEMHQPDRLLGRAATWTGTAGDGDRKARIGVSQRAPGHGAGDVLAHRAMLLDQPIGDSQHLALGGVLVGDEAPVKHVRRAGDRRQRRRDEPAGAGLRGGDEIAFGPGQIENFRRERYEPFVDIDPLRHGRRTVALAMAATPSPRPTKPSPSLVVALTLTRSTSIPSVPAMAPRMASR